MAQVVVIVPGQNQFHLEGARLCSSCIVHFIQEIESIEEVAAQLYIYKLDMMLGSHLVWLVLMLESCQSHLCTLSETYTIH